MRSAWKRPKDRDLATLTALALCHCLWPVAAAGAGEVDVLLFGSLDAGAAQFMTIGTKLGLGALDRDGFAVLTSVGAGRRDEGGAREPRRRYTAAAAAVLGYQWFSDWGVIALYAGPEFAIEMLVDGRRVLPAPGEPGLRLQGELWARPSEMTLVQATAVAGSARGSLWTRLAAGYRVWGTYLGPEVGAYLDATGYWKWNLGLHGTDFDVGRFSARLSAGLQVESGPGRASPYVALSVWTPW